MNQAKTGGPDAVKNRNDPYEGLAAIYDQVMCGVDYESWADYVAQLLSRFGKTPRSLVDLACGTGSSSLPFARRGYRVTGVDISSAMLEQARLKAMLAGLDVRFCSGNLCRLQLPERYDLALLFQDGLNYILSTTELSGALAEVNAALNPGSLFIFDLTRPGLRSGGDKNSVCWADGEDFALIWESSFRSQEGLWEVLLTVFHRLESGHYRKFQEKHREKDYPPDLVGSLLEEAGFALLGLYPSFSLEPARGFEPKLTFVAEKGMSLS